MTSIYLLGSLFCGIVAAKYIRRRRFLNCIFSLGGFGGGYNDLYNGWLVTLGFQPVLAYSA